MNTVDKVKYFGTFDNEETPVVSVRGSQLSVGLSCRIQLMDPTFNKNSTISANPNTPVKLATWQNQKRQ